MSAITYSRWQSCESSYLNDWLLFTVCLSLTLHRGVGEKKKELEVRDLFTEAGALIVHIMTVTVWAVQKMMENVNKLSNTTSYQTELNTSADWVMKLCSTWMCVLQKVPFGGLSECKRTYYGVTKRTSQSFPPADKHSSRGPFTALWQREADRFSPSFRRENFAFTLLASHVSTLLSNEQCE